MAGSYKHCVANDGRLLDNERLVGMLENGGDVYEAVEEMYGMIWYLASQIEGAPAAELVNEARQNYKLGLGHSPGVVEEGEPLSGWDEDDE